MSATSKAPVTLLRFRLEGQERTAKGRVAWALNELVMAGPEGITSLQNPAPRMSDYIFKARKLGVDIETIHEGHGGAYAGHHGRYRLQSDIEVIETKTAADVEGVANV